jgi:hypothetical protein
MQMKSYIFTSERWRVGVNNLSCFYFNFKLIKNKIIKKSPAHLFLLFWSVNAHLFNWWGIRTGYQFLSVIRDKPLLLTASYAFNNVKIEVKKNSYIPEALRVPIFSNLGMALWMRLVGDPWKFLLMGISQQSYQPRVKKHLHRSVHAGDIFLITIIYITVRKKRTVFLCS